MTILLWFITSPIGRAIILIAVVLIGDLGIYAKGRIDGKASYKAKIERQINEAVQKGDDGRADALRKLNDGGVPDGWFRD